MLGNTSGRRNSKRGCVWVLNSVRRPLLRENRKVEEMANGRAGTPNQYGQYFGKEKTLNE
jgi:hypothetical protein